MDMLDSVLPIYINQNEYYITIVWDQRRLIKNIVDLKAVDSSVVIVAVRISSTHGNIKCIAIPVAMSEDAFAFIK